MPAGICAFPYPMGEPDEDDLEASALDEQLVATRLVVPEPEPAATKGQCAYGTPNDGCPKGQHCQSGVCTCDCPSKTSCKLPPPSGVCPGAAPS